MALDLSTRVRRVLGKGAVADVVLALIRHDGLSEQQLVRRSTYRPGDVRSAIAALKAGQMATQRDGRLTLRGREFWLDLLGRRRR
jgi:hypothetical protein